jgi:hypothetical protein
MGSTKDKVEGAPAFTSVVVPSSMPSGSQTSCSAGSATTFSTLPLLSFSSCICRASTRNGGSHFRPMNQHCCVTRMCYPPGIGAKAMSISGTENSYVKFTSEPVIFIMYLYKHLEQYNSDHDTVYRVPVILLRGFVPWHAVVNDAAHLNRDSCGVIPLK